MASSILIRLGGLAAMVGGAIYAVSASLVGRGGVGTLRWSLVLFLLGMMAVIAALHFLQRERERYDNWGALASVAALLGVALTVGGYILVDFVVSLEGLGATVFLVGALVGTMGILGLAIVTLQAGVLPRWGGAALAAGNPLLAVFISVVSYFVFFALGSWLVASPWIVVGFAVFLAAGPRTERPSRVR
jgi:hypothetical protein